MFDIRSFYQAKDVRDAVRALCENEHAMVISGGTDVLVQNREGKHAGAALVSIHGLKELEGVRMEADGTLVIGAATCFTDITNNPLVQQHIPMLGLAVDQVGSPQIRNIATVGGNLCNGVTSADSAPSLLSLEAVLRLKGENGTRDVPLSEFYTGPGKTVRERTEVLVEVRIPKESYDGVYGAYIKYGKRKAMEISTLGCAVNVRLQGNTIDRVRVAYGVAAATPIRCTAAEEAALHKPATLETVKEAAKAAMKSVNPRTSWRASKEFRLHLTGELLRRAMAQAINQAGGNVNV